MWFSNAKLYRLAPEWNVGADQIRDALLRHAFKPSSSLEMQSLGWVPARDGGDLVHEVGGQILVAMRAERKLLPASVVTQVTRARALEIEEQQGYKPGRKQTREIKERVTDELLPKAFSIYRDTRVWIDPANRWLAIDAAADSKADEILALLARSIDPFPLESLCVVQSPAAAMTSWLVDDEPPANFTIDQDTELRSTGASGAAIRYVKQSIDIDDARRHVQAGKLCTRLALTWADRVSFVLTEGLDIKRIAALDILTEGGESTALDADEKFDADMTLMTGELSKLFTDLVHALGGIQLDLLQGDRQGATA